MPQVAEAVAEAGSPPAADAALAPLDVSEPATEWEPARREPASGSADAMPNGGARRGAHGDGGPRWGWRSYADLPIYCLGGANFPETPDEDYRPELRQRHAQAPQHWSQDTQREARARSCFYGQEHYNH